MGGVGGRRGVLNVKDCAPSDSVSPVSLLPPLAREVPEKATSDALVLTLPTSVLALTLAPLLPLAAVPAAALGDDSPREPAGGGRAAALHAVASALSRRSSACRPVRFHTHQGESGGCYVPELYNLVPTGLLGEAGMVSRACRPGHPVGTSAWCPHTDTATCAQTEASL